MSSAATRTLGVFLLCLLAGCAGPDLLYEGKGDLSHAPLSAELIRLGAQSDRGSVIGPVNGIAFLNDTRNRVLSIRFPSRVLPDLRCSFTNGFTADEESTFTSQPLPPGAVVTVCFHSKGRLELEVHGLGKVAELRTVLVGSAE